MTIAKNITSNPLICKVEYAFPEDILSMQNVELNQVRITMQTAKVFNNIYGTPSSYNFTEPSDVSTSGLLFKQKLTLYYPGLETATQKLLQVLERRKAVFKITYQHGIVQVIGSLDVPAKFFNSFVAGDATGCSITISCENDERARFLIE
ncbi:MAG: hypothetical protein ACOYN4_05270 [Bacteroidales bacterium]